MPYIPPHIPVVKYPDTTNRELLLRIMDFMQEAINQGATIAPRFKSGDARKNVFEFLTTQVRYKADGHKQIIVKPLALLAIGQGDCKSFTLFMAGVLVNLGYKVTVRFAGYTPGGRNYTHVYCIANGVIVDPVYGVYGSEKPYSYKKDFIIKTQ